MKNKCSSCESIIPFARAFFASKSFPATCKNCGVKNYRNHMAAYYFLMAVFSVGLLSILFFAMAKGFVFAKYLGLSYISIFCAVYIGEVVFADLKEYEKQLEQKVSAQGKRNAALGLALIVASVLFYVVIG